MKTRKALDDLNRALRELHQALVKVARHEYEKEWGQVDPGQLLQLLTRHPQFDWLHQLSEFMVDIDEILDNEMVSKADMRTIFAQAKSMLSQSVTEPSDFSTHYFEAMHGDPAIVMAHANVRRVLASR
ncbi:hypothetical protein ACFQAT_26620 [Undibacterium arcticum]|uniref:Uncharacterized protein n=1 Tax=Undibacterium arcticum TaxID=1762892 RepID=A0ABV7EX85_9BURK